MVGEVQGLGVFDRRSFLGVTGGADLERGLAHRNLLVEGFSIGIGEECRACAYAGVLDGVGGIG